MSTNSTTRIGLTIYWTPKEMQGWYISVNINMYVSTMECMREDQYALNEFDQ